MKERGSISTSSTGKGINSSGRSRSGVVVLVVVVVVGGGEGGVVKY